MTEPILCKKCKQPCDATCTACRKGHVLHYRCMKPGDRLLVRLGRWNWRLDLTIVVFIIGMVLIPLPVLMSDIPFWWTLVGSVLAAPGLLRMFWTTCS